MTEALRSSLERVQRPDVASVADRGIAAALDMVGDPNWTNRLAEAQVAARAIHAPNTELVAAIGSRPHKAGDHQMLWDQTVASRAVYEHRYGSPESMSEMPVVPPGSTLAQQNDGLMVEQLTIKATDAAVARVPLEQLLTERADLQAIDPTRIMDEAWQQVRQAEHVVFDAGEAVRFGREPQTVLDEAQRALTAATRHCVDVEARHAHEAVRLQAVEKGLALRIDQATATPAAYVFDALGPKPEKGPPKTAWERASKMIERLRHHDGLTPAHGKQSGTTPLAKAVGTASVGLPGVSQIMNALHQSLTKDHDLSQSQSMDIGR